MSSEIKSHSRRETVEHSDTPSRNRSQSGHYLLSQWDDLSRHNSSLMIYLGLQHSSSV